jgi:hypothetical protein
MLDCVLQMSLSSVLGLGISIDLSMFSQYTELACYKGVLFFLRDLSSASWRENYV